LVAEEDSNPLGFFASVALAIRERERESVVLFFLI
jgi:hypothetical protein